MTDDANSYQAGRKNGGMRTFTVVWTGQFVSMLGSAMVGFALAIWAWLLTGQATALAMVAFFSFAPTILMSPIAGALVDRWNRKKTMILSDLAAGIGSIVILAIYLAGGLQIWHLCAVGAFSGIFQSFQFPAYSAAITTMVDKKHYARTNSMMAMAGSASIIIAPMLAAFLLGPIGIAGILVLDIITFTYAISVILMADIPQPAESKDGKESKGSLWKESLYGFKYIRERPSLFSLLLIFFLFNLVATAGQTVLAPMLLARTANNEMILGSVMSIFGIGGIVGGLVITAWGGPKRKIHGILLGMAAGSLLGITLIGLGQSMYVWAIGAFIAAAVFPVLGSSSQAIWQSKVAPDVQGRVFAARRMIAQVCVPISMLISGPLADRVFEPAMMDGGSLTGIFGWLVGTGPGAGMGLMLVLAGIGSAIIALAAYGSKNVRNIEDILPDHDAVPEPVPEPISPEHPNPGPESPHPSTSSV